MNLLETALRQAAGDLTKHAGAWGLVGGLAVSVRAEPRFTRDVDIAVAVADDAAAEQLVRSLIVEGYRVLASLEQDATGRLATVRLACPGAAESDDDVVLDLLFASNGIEPEIARTADRIEVVPGLVLPVARTGHLIALKLLARDDDSRPQDQADLRALRRAATGLDLEEARAAVDQIVGRGYHRGRGLHAELAAFVAE